jgi:asparagine synthase (glutamine-hydrolysing)
MLPPGVLALSLRGPVAGAADQVRAALASTGATDPVLHEEPGLLVATWGGLDPGPDGSLLLSRGPRRHERDLDPGEVADLLARRDVSALAEVIPPFAAFRRLPRGEAVAVTDALGFRHVYHAQWADRAAVSTSARLLAVLGGCALDRDALALQSLLGWQVGDATLFEGVTKLAAGTLVSVAEGRLTLVGGRAADPAPMELDEAVDTAASVLRDHLAAYVGDHPDATLQLTGGQDSRILLSAVPPALRTGLRAITLRVPGSPDADIAAAIASRTGLRHHVEELEDLTAMSPADAFAACLDASRRLEGMADPVALAGLTIAERRFDQGHRIAGLGGEVARGFYYLGNPRDTTVSRAKVARLTAWRMFANEAIDPAALRPAVRAGARDGAIDRIHALMAGTGKEWLEATDDFYLYQRMQRWAGVTDTAVCLDRSVVNPMLDDRFISVAQAMSPASKRGSRFLGRLQMALDPGLGRMPLDGRPPPAAYADPSLLNRARAAETLARKAVRKARQRLGHSTRPPAGGAVLAAKVLEHWRHEPETLRAALVHDVLDEAWVDQVVAGTVSPDPGTVAFALNLVALGVEHAGASTR